MIRLLKNVVVMAIIVPLLAAAAVAEEPLRVGGDVTRPEKLTAPPPVYTELARRGRVQGTVIVESVIDAEGNVTKTRVLKGLPMGLDQVALDAVQKWKFKPATLKGEPVKVYYTLTVNFKLQ
jgi:protein TonB